MLPALTTIFLVVAFVSVHANTHDELVDTQATLSSIGLRGSIASMHMIELQNMDSSLLKEEAEVDDDGNDDPFGETLVVKGHPAYPGMFQFQAGLILNTSLGYFQICGAILLSSRRALTAAHCTPYFTGNITFDHFLGVGIQNRSMGLLNPGAQMVRISHAETHRKWVGDHDRGYPHDIAILYLEENIVPNKYVQFAQLAKAEDGDFEHYVCTVSGWGFTENGRPDILQFGYQYITSKKDCQNFWEISGGKKLISKRHICGHFYPTSGCSGDSGGPLTCGQVVAGIVSWGLGSCSGCFPNVYTRITSYANWIDKRL